MLVTSACLHLDTTGVAFQLTERNAVSINTLELIHHSHSDSCWDDGRLRDQDILNWILINLLSKEIPPRHVGVLHTTSHHMINNFL